MSQEFKYRIVLLDQEGYDLSERTSDNLKEAKAEMLYMLSDQYAQTAESTHQQIGTFKAEVRNRQDECILDAFYHLAAGEQ